jgi:threonine synthase
LFIPEQIPKLPEDWSHKWRDLTFQELAFEVLSLYISSSEISSHDLKGIIQRSYLHFRTPNITPLISLDREKQLYLLELFHGPTFAFKDVALQFLGELFEYFLLRKNKGKEGKDRDHLTVIGATSGDTGSAAIYGLRGRQDLSIFMLFPKGKVSPVQEAQMTSIMDDNVHNVSVEGSFDDCQDTVKALFADPETNRKHKLAAVNSISFARINAQMVYYFHAYFSLLRSPDYDSSKGIDFVVPSGNFGDILAGWFAKRMDLPFSGLVIATNSNDILDRFMSTGTYSKQPIHGPKAEGGFSEDGAKAHPSGVKETLAPAMDILVSSNFERLLAYLAIDTYAPSDPSTEAKLGIMREKVTQWLHELKTVGGFKVDAAILEAARKDFSSERVDDDEIISTIHSIYKTSFPHVAAAEGTTGKTGGYILDPHSAIGIAASLRHISASGSGANTIALATAHPAKFANAVDKALTGAEGYSFDDVLPAQFKEFENMPGRVMEIGGKDRFGEIRAIMDEKILGEKA